MRYFFWGAGADADARRDVVMGENLTLNLGTEIQPSGKFVIQARFQDLLLPVGTHCATAHKECWFSTAVDTISRQDFIRIPSAGGCQKGAGSRDCTGEVSPNPAPPSPGAQGAPGRGQARAGQRNTRNREPENQQELKMASL